MSNVIKPLIENGVNDTKNILEQKVNSLSQSVTSIATDKVNGAKDAVENKINDAKAKIDNVKSKVEDNFNSLKKKSQALSDSVSKISNKFKANPMADHVDTQQGQLSEIDLNSLVQPYENILLDYNTYTYNFCLYAMDAQSYSMFLKNPDTEVQKAIIAQSGVTGRYGIGDVTIDTVGPATPGQTTNYSLNTASIELFEQGGMQLFDDLIMMSNTLGYKKLADVPLVLELFFVGFKGDTGAGTKIPNCTRRWGVRINNITCESSEAGGTIKYKLILTANTSIFNNAMWTLKEPYSCVSNKFGEFIQDIESKLNQMAEDQYGYLSSIIPELANKKYYEIKVQDEIAAMQIIHDPKQSNEVTQTRSGADGSKQFTWSAKAPISRIIDDVLDCCTPMVSNGGTPNNTNRQFVNVIPVSQYVGYDPIRCTNAYKYIIYIIKYKIGDITSTDDLTPERFTLQYFIDNADKVLDPIDGIPKLPMKRYDYQFTGKNTEILNLELKFDQQFHIAVLRNPQSQIDPNNSAGTHTSEFLELGDKQYNTALKVDRVEIWGVKNDFDKRIKNGETLTEKEKQEYRDATNFINSALKPVKPDVEGANEQKEMMPSDALPTYIEDFRDEYDLTELATSGIGMDNQIQSIPLDVDNINLTNDASLGNNSSDKEINRRLTRDNYYNRSFLIKLDMKVVGDPYWLGWSDYAYLNYVEQAVNGQQLNLLPNDIHTANYLTSEAYLLLNLRPNISISDSTGILDFTQPSVLNQSIYRINKVTSVFSGGKFTQQLMAALIIRSLRKTSTDTGNYDDKDM